MLPHIAPPSMLGRISGWAWGMGYLGGLLCLVLSLTGLLTLPALTILSDLVALFGGALYCAGELSLPIGIFFDRVFEVLVVDDVIHGVLKSFIFAVIIVLIGAANGFNVNAGAEGVGRATTRAVVLGCIGIILADMVFTFLTSR